MTKQPTMTEADTGRCLLTGPAGAIEVAWSPAGVTSVRFVDPSDVASANGSELPAALEGLQAYLRGDQVDFDDVPVDLSACTPFHRKVLGACRQIKYGKTATYADLARRVGKPSAARAVGGAMRRNPIPIIIPCHRIVASCGGLGGFSAPEGVSLKERLLAMERSAID